MSKFNIKKSILTDLPLLIGLAGGAAWVAGNYFGLIHFTTCIYKNLTGIPCSACGSTRATIKILHGQIVEGICMNPNTLLFIVFALTFPFVFYLRHSSRPEIYRQINNKMRSLWFILPFVCFEIAIWIHNIYLGL